MYEELFFRNTGAITKREQQLLRKSMVVIVGLGGTGGYVLENLLRTGMESIVVFDGDKFELSNMNRQRLCSIPALDRPKTEVAKDIAKQINPKARVKAHEKFTSESDGLIKSASVVIDCTDNVRSHIAINETCNKIGIPQIFATCNYSSGMVSVLEKKALRKMFKLPVDDKKLEKYGKCSSILASAATVAGGLAAAQATARLLGKHYIQAPNVLMFDLFAEKMFWTERLE